MRVGLVLPGGVDRTGTLRVVPCLLWLIERLTAQHEVLVFALRQETRPSRYRLLGAEVVNIGPAWMRSRALAAIAREHRRTPLDLLHGVWAAPAGVLAGLAGQLLRLPVLLHLTGGDLAALPAIGYGLRDRAIGRMWLRLAVRLADRVTVPSDAMVERAAELRIPASRLTFGVALDRWPVREPKARGNSVPSLLHVGSLNPVKDQETLLRAAARLNSAGIRFRLHIVGEDTLAGRVQRRAVELGLADSVTFHGFLPHPELRPLFERADLLLISSRHEADPIVLLEAAVAGVPAVGTRVGHLADWAPEAAVAVPVGDDRALADEIVALLAADDRRLRVARAAQHRALDHDADATSRSVLDLYRELTAGAAHPG